MRSCRAEKSPGAEKERAHPVNTVASTMSGLVVRRRLLIREPIEWPTRTTFFGFTAAFLGDLSLPSRM